MPVEPSRPPWGWTLPARGLLAALAILGAAGLLIVAPKRNDRPRDMPRLIVDPNTAPPAVLSALPRLGPSLVGRIVAARAEAPFRSLQDFDERVPGIGPATIEALRDHLRFGPEPTPAPSDPIAHNAP